MDKCLQFSDSFHHDCLSSKAAIKEKFADVNLRIFRRLMDHILSGLFTMTRPSWVAPQAWLGFTELDKAVVLV